MIIGRNNSDNDALGKIVSDEIVFQTADFPGPLGIVQAQRKLKRKEIELAASLVLRYNSKINDNGKVNYGSNFKLGNHITTAKMTPEESKKFII